MLVEFSQVDADYLEMSYLVFSSDWEVRVDADSMQDAVLIGTKSEYIRLGEKFNIAHVVSVLDEKTGEIDVFSSVAVFEDLNMYVTASNLDEILKEL